MEKKFEETVYKMAALLDEKNAEDIVLIDVSKVTIIADTFVICSGRAANHVKMLADELEQALGKEGIYRSRMEGYQRCIRDSPDTFSRRKRKQCRPPRP